MRTNSFTTNMKTKSNKDLETILVEKNKYTEEALQAVTWELENRNLIEKAVIPFVEISKEDSLSTPFKTKEILESDESPFAELVTPFLYSKKAIQGFTIFFTTIFGAVLLMKNLKDMNKPKESIQVLSFGVLYTLLSIILLNFLPKTVLITLAFNLLGYAVLIEYFWNKNLGKDLAYRKKPIWQPLATSILIVLVLVLIQLYPQFMA